MSKVVQLLLRALHSADVVDKLAQSPLMRRSAQTAHSVVEMAKDRTQTIGKRSTAAHTHSRQHTVALPPLSQSTVHSRHPSVHPSVHPSIRPSATSCCRTRRCLPSHRPLSPPLPYRHMRSQPVLALRRSALRRSALGLSLTSSHSACTALRCADVCPELGSQGVTVGSLVRSATRHLPTSRHCCAQPLNRPHPLSQ